MRRWLGIVLVALAGCGGVADAPVHLLTVATTSTVVVTLPAVTTTVPAAHASPARANRSMATPRRSGPQPPAGAALPPTDLLARIRRCESGGDYMAYNRSSGASGAYQYLRSTWANYGAYSEARWAPPAVQDERAAADLARVGTRPWYSSRACWS